MGSCQKPVLRKLLYLLVAMVFVIAAAGCGGSSSSGNSGGTVTPPGDVTDPPDTSDPPVVTSAVLQLRGEVKAATARPEVEVGAVAVQAAASEAPVAGARVSVALFDANGQRRLDEATGEPLRLLATTDEDGLFSLQLPPMTEAEKPSRIEVTVQRQGFVEGTRVIRNIDLAAGRLDVRSLLAPEAVVTVTRNDGLVFGASGEPVFRFGLVRDGGGVVSAVAGDDLNSVRAANTHEQLLDLEIPVARVAEHVQAVTAGLAHFDPFDAEQVQSFPGDFVGSGDPDVLREGVTFDITGGVGAASANEEEYRLISTVFAQVRLRDQDGNVMELAGDGLGAASASNPTMTLQVPRDAYITITEDREPDTVGVQVPIYAYYGGWKFVGNGTLMTWGDGGYQTFAYTGSQWPLAHVTEDLYVQIEITEGNQWITWINLDWPIRAGELTEYCLSADIAYAGSGEAFSGWVDLRLPDGGYEWTSTSNGRVDFTTVSAAGAEGWLIGLWNPRTNEWVERAITPRSCPSSARDAVELVNPRQCSVAGEVRRGGQALPGAWVNATGSNVRDWGQADGNGEFRLDVPCGVPVTLRSEGGTAEVRVDGTVNHDELADDGTEAKVAITAANQPPVISVYGQDQAVLPSGGGNVTVPLWVYAWDPDGDDLTVTVACPAGAICTPTELTGTGEVFQRIDLSTAVAGNYDWSLTVSDGSALASDGGRLVVDAAENRAPRITAVTRSIERDGSFQPPVTLNCRTEGDVLVCPTTQRGTDQVRYRVSAFDPDGDTLSYGWDSYCTAGSATCIVSSLTADQSLQVTVSDEELQAKARIDIGLIENQAPIIGYAFADPTRSLTDGAGYNRSVIALTARASDDADPMELLDFVWTVTPSADAELEPFELYGPDVEISAGTLPVGSYRVELVVTDTEDEPSDPVSFMVSVVLSQSELELIIQ